MNSRYYLLKDDEAIYGIVKTYLEENEFVELLDAYVENDECYNIDGFIEYLKEHKVEANLIDFTELYF